MKNGFQIYDAHTHAGEAAHSGRRYTPDQLLAAMDRFGVDRSLVIPYPVVPDMRAAHDAIGGAMRRRPDRLMGCACIPAALPQRLFRDEVKRCAEELGFRALKLQPQYQPLNPISPRSDYFFETAREHGMTLVVHTGSGVPFALPSLYIAPARKFPDLRIVLAHSGGTLFYQEAIVAASVCPNISLELSSLMPHHITELLDHVAPSRLMIGSDLPESLETELGKILGLELGREAKQQILWDTALELFSLRQ